MTEQKVWLEVALNGPWSRARQPGIPVAVREIVAEGIACAQAGAAIVHVHAYDETTGRQKDDPDLYAAIIEGIRARIDAIVYPTLPFAGSPGCREAAKLDERGEHEQTPCAAEARGPISQSTSVRASLGGDHSAPDQAPGEPHRPGARNDHDRDHAGRTCGRSSGHVVLRPFRDLLSDPFHVLSYGGSTRPDSSWIACVALRRANIPLGLDRQPGVKQCARG